MVGYTPYDGSANPAGFISGITAADVSNALGYQPGNLSSYIKNITPDSTQEEIAEMYYDISTAIHTDVCNFHHYYLIEQQPIIK